MAREFDILALGSPILDAVLDVSFDDLKSVTNEARGMVAVTKEEQETIISSVETPPEYSMGGSASNTAAATARLGLKSGLLGKIGNDEHGKIYVSRATDINLDTSMLKKSENLNTACCLCLITPDGERTMRTHLGAAQTITVKDVCFEDILRYKHIHLEAYILFNPDFFIPIVRFAKENGIKVSIDLGSFEIVRDYKDFLVDFLPKYIDILFANEDEAVQFGETKEIKSICPTVVLMQGKNGASVYTDYGKNIYQQSAYKEKRIIDKVGAGDHFAAGFLYGYLKNLSVRESASIATLLATSSIEHRGAEMPKEVWDELIKDIKNGKFIR